MTPHHIYATTTVAGQEGAVARFLARLVGRTQENYARDLGAWAVWLDGRGVPLLDAGRQDVEEYVATMVAERGWAPATVCTVIGHLAGFYRWCAEEGLDPVSPTLLVRRPSRPRHAARVWLGRGDLARLLDASLTWRDGGLVAHTHLWALSGYGPANPAPCAWRTCPPGRDAPPWQSPPPRPPAGPGSPYPHPPPACSPRPPPDAAAASCWSTPRQDDPGPRPQNGCGWPACASTPACPP